jgi:hypothetical protein
VSDDDCPPWCKGHGKPEYILCAANHYDDGEKYDHQPRNITQGFVVAGRRHHNCITTFAIMARWKDPEKMQRVPCVQGFLTSKDRFLNRVEARQLAISCGQLTGEDDRNVHGIIMSEDLW